MNRLLHKVRKIAGLSSTKRVVLAVLLCALPMFPDPQNGRVITITAGTAIRVILNPSLHSPVKANSILFQALHGGSGVIYVLNTDPQGTCSTGTAGTTLVAELAPATATAPGGSFTFPSNGSSVTTAGGTDVRYWCVDGATSGDTVAVSWDVRN